MSDGVLSTQLSQLHDKLANCRHLGGAHQDPIRFYYLQSLLERLSARPEELQAEPLMSLVVKARAMLEQLSRQLEQEPVQTGESAKDSRGRTNQRTVLRQLIASSGRPAIRSSDDKQSDSPDKTPTIQRDKNTNQDLNALQAYQSLFENMAVERLLAKVMKEIPENAGPLNPERLVIRCLSLAQQISPAYAMRLISYYDGLTSLQDLLGQTK